MIANWVLFISMLQASETINFGVSPRVDRLLNAEEVVTKAGGSVVRLAGLYHATRGAHMYYKDMTEIPTLGNSLLNLIHYEVGDML